MGLFDKFKNIFTKEKKDIEEIIRRFGRKKDFKEIER